MRRILRLTGVTIILMVVCLYGQTTFAQSVGISGVAITPDPQSLLELRSTTKGVLLPRLTAAQRITLTGAPLGAGDEGLTIFNTSTDRYNYWDGGQWIEMATSSAVTGITLDDAYDGGGSGLGRSITADAGAVEINGAGGLLVNGNLGVGITPTMKFEVSGGNMGLQGNRGFAFGGNNSNTPDTSPDAQLVLDGSHNAGYNLGGTKLLIRGIDNESNTKAISVVDENSNELFYVTSQPSGSGLSHFRGDVAIGNTTASSDLHVYRGDADIARVYATGGNQGSGMFFAGQSPTYGGGFVYDGDGTPALVGGNDRITFFRRNNGSDAEVMSYGYSSNVLRVLGLSGSGTRPIYAESDGDLTDVAPTTGTLGFWSRTGTNLSPLNIGDNVGIGIAAASERLHVNGSVRGNQSGALRVSTGFGYVDIGPKNTTWSHFYTDRSRYYFDKGITVDQGLIGSYNENLNLQTSGSTRMTILTSNGYVGIGNTNPSERLEVNGNIELTGGDMDLKVSSGYLDLRTNDASHGLILRTHTGANTNWGGIRVISGGTMQLRADGGSYDQLTLRDGGNVGVGTSTPTYKLHVIGRLKTTGINETSDVRLKKNIEPITGALDHVLNMEGVTYNWKKGEFPEMGLNGGKQHGLIAQDLEKIIPELVLTDEEGWKSIEYTHLVPVLIEALKEQNQIIVGQKEDIDALQDKAEANSKLIQELIDQVNGYSHNK